MSDWVFYCRKGWIFYVLCLIKCVFDLWSLLQFCMDYETSDKSRYPTFARTRPPDTQISKSVVSVLLNFNWTQASGTFAHRIWHSRSRFMPDARIL
jgi:hypothetical protein